MLPTPLFLIRQHFPDHRLADVRAEARRQLDRSGFAARLRPGARVAIGVGSRGIANIAAIVHTAVQYWQGHGMAPFVFPAMGSHGAATPEGQAAVLARLGITERSIGCPSSAAPTSCRSARQTTGSRCSWMRRHTTPTR